MSIKKDERNGRPLGVTVTMLRVSTAVGVQSQWQQQKQ